MTRRQSSGVHPVIVIGALALALMWSHDAEAAREQGKKVPLGKGKKPGQGSRATLPAKKRTTTQHQSPVIDVDSPKKKQLTPAELDAMRKRADASKKAGTVPASPELEPRHGRTPPGYAPDKARASAREIAALLAKKGPKAYDHHKLFVWQTWAGLRPDGEYGGSTRGALVFFGVPDPPRPFSAPYATLPYAPPSALP